MKTFITTLLLTLVGTACLQAQESQTTYNFLRLPVSAHAAALGGDNITLIEDDASLMFHNPALLSSVGDKTVGLNFMTYMEGSTTASASFNRNINDKASWAVSGQFMNYGSMREMDADGQQTGDFSAKDIAVAGYFAYMLSNRIAGGITAKLISSHIGSYNSMGVGFDLGVNYYDPDRDISLSFVAKNLGGQIKAYNDDFEPIPIDVQIGASRRFEHTPFRVSATLVDLNHWGYRFINHLVMGVDMSLSDALWIGAGYNFRRADEMRIENSDGKSAHGAGLSFGAGVNLDRFKVNLAYGKYHVSSSSIVINAAFNL